uniref:Uncharacterized protein n=1 Tax=Daphnia galeata TaxID=27404 RepID=A0A8J2RLQ4_9CRUS|nr:unnamed protein product [Daphnia galeata]
MSMEKLIMRPVDLWARLIAICRFFNDMSSILFEQLMYDISRISSSAFGGEKEKLTYSTFALCIQLMWLRDSYVFWLLFIQVYQTANENFQKLVLKAIISGGHPCCCLPLDIIYQVLLERILEVPEYLKTMERFPSRVPECHSNNRWLLPTHSHFEVLPVEKNHR